MVKERIAGSLAQRQQGFSLPRDFYVDEAFFRADVEAVFETDWLFACSVAEIPCPGDFLTLRVGHNPIVVLRNRNGEIAGFHNSCRHRGSQICQKEKGRVNRLVCPYHQWVYELDGKLINARQMPESFDPEPYSLAPVHVEVICGMVYICLAEDPPSLDRYRAGITPYIAPHMPDRTKVAYSETIIEQANWKLVIENNRECYHCAANHPELLVSMVEFALPDDPRVAAQFQGLMDRARERWDALGLPHEPADGGNEFRCIRLPFNENTVSFTLDGNIACKKLLGNLTEPDLGSVRMFRVPHNWNHFLSDHIIHFRVLPISADRTELRTTWLVHEDAVEGVDYDVEHLTAVWKATNSEDGMLAENNHRGVLSKAYRPGPYAPSEFMLTHFTDWYAGKMAKYAGISPAAMAAE